MAIVDHDGAEVASHNLEPLAYTYSDGAWTATTPPEPPGGNCSLLNDVACTALDTCVAIGDYSNELLADTYSPGT